MERKKRKGSVMLVATDADTQRTGSVMLDKGRMMFWAEVFNQDGVPSYYEHKNGDDVKRWLRDELAKAPADLLLTWVPVVLVEVTKGANRYGSEPNKTSHGLGVELERFYLALTPDRKEWRRLEWEEVHPGGRGVIPDAMRYKRSDRFRTGPGETNTVFDTRHNVDRPFTLPSSEQGRSHERGTAKHYMEWTPEVWKGLLSVVELIRDAHEAIVDIVGTEKGMAMLADVGAGKIPLRLGSGS